MDQRWLVSLVFVGACNAPVDFADAGVDATGAAIDAAPAIDSAPTTGLVTVRVRNAGGTGAPDAAATIYITDPAGALTTTAMPDATGTALVEVSAGDAVTVRAGDLVAWTTVVGVEPGDELWFGAPVTWGAGQMTVTLPAAAGATGYQLGGPCMRRATSSTPTLTVVLAPGCSPTRPVLAIAERTGAPAQLLTASLTAADGASATLAGTWSDAAAATATVVGLPGSGASIGAELLAGGVPAVDARAMLGGTTATWRGAGTPARVAIAFPDRDGRYELRADLAAGASTLDATPRVPAITGQPSPTDFAFDLTAPAPADAIAILTAEFVPKGGSMTSWTFVLPPTARRWVRPQIAGAPDTIALGAAVIDVAAIGDYDQLRPRAGESGWTASADVHVWSTF